MAVKTQDDLPPDDRVLYLKAISAFELRNFAYAVALLQAVLKKTPEFLDGRKTMRKAEIASSKGKKSFLSGISTASMKGGQLMKKDPLAAIELAEKTLEHEPYSGVGNHLLHDAAKAAGFMETAGFALETLAEGNPKDTKVLHELAEHYSATDQADRAVDVYTKIAALNPADLVALKRGKDASARASMRSGGWETAKDYRDLIQNKEMAVALEQQNRAVKTGDVLEGQINDLSERLKAEPENIDVVRRIAGLYEQGEQFVSALEWYQYAEQLGKGVDPQIARKVSDLGMKILQEEIEGYEQYLANPPADADPELLPQYDEELKRLKGELSERLISEAEKRVSRNPTDPQYKYELGEQLIVAGRFRDAIKWMQQARTSPHVRLKAMKLLGQCYDSLGMLDLAEKVYSEAKGEILGMDDNKKDITYRLGLVYEKMGKKEPYLDCMKEIYDADYGYMDVAARVEGSYGN